MALVKGWADAWWEVGIAFGTVGARKGDVVVEVTTYRDEVYHSDSRKPEVSYGHSLEEDLRRRDLTVNAMAVTVPGKEFVDPFGGLADLAAGLLRTPGRPEDSFDDDPLRMLRVARFAAQLGFAVDPAVEAAMTAMAGPDRHRVRGAGARRAGQAGLRAAAAGRPGAAGADRAGRAGAARAAAARAGDRRAPPAQGRLRAHPDRARAGDGAGAGTAPTSCCGWPR